jgi:NAD(P)-dependent dehydrogenase (short-subunit alcohol dehydrogenase family)
MALEGKICAITGGASGIGLATAKVVSQRGGTVCIADVDADAIKAADAYFGALGVRYSVAKVDITQRGQVDSWIDGIVRDHGRLDGAANVAGIIGKIHGKLSVADMDDDEWNKIMAVNLTGTMYCLRAELRHIEERGSIVNVSSIHGLKGKLEQGHPINGHRGILIWRPLLNHTCQAFLDMLLMMPASTV